MLFRGLDAFHIRYRSGMGSYSTDGRVSKTSYFGQGFVTSTITTVFTVSLLIVLRFRIACLLIPRLSLPSAWLPSPLGSPQNAGYSFSIAVMYGWRM